MFEEIYIIIEKCIYVGRFFKVYYVVAYFPIKFAIFTFYGIL